MPPAVLIHSNNGLGLEQSEQKVKMNLKQVALPAKQRNEIVIALLHLDRLHEPGPPLFSDQERSSLVSDIFKGPVASAK